jgi:predicted RNase H-like HicB family nuclease
MANGRMISLNFLIYRCEESPDKFVAHCLETDVVAVGSTKPAAVELLKELLEDLFNAALEDGTFGKVLTPAPRRYWEMLARAKPYRPPARVVKRHIRSRPVDGVSYALATTS